MADEIQKLIYQVEGETKLREATSLLEQQRKSYEQLKAVYDAQLKAGQLTAQQHSAWVRTEAVALKQVMDNVERLQKAFGGGRNGMQGIAGGANNLAFAIQDFVSTSGGLAQKLNSVTNNLQMIALSLGASGKLFLGITAGVSAIQLFVQNFEKISDWLNLVDRAKLEEVQRKAEELKKRFENLQQTPSDTQGNIADAWKKALDGPTTDAVRKGVYENLFNSPFGERWTDADRGAVRDAGRRGRYGGGGPMGGPGFPETDAMVAERVERVTKQINDRINAANATRSADMVAQASMPGADGDQARRQIMQMIGANRGAFPKGFAPLVDMLNAESRKADEDWAPIQKAREERAKERERAGWQREKDLIDEKNRSIQEAEANRPASGVPNFLERRAAARAAEAPVSSENTQADAFIARGLAEQALGLVDTAAADTAMGAGESDIVVLLNQIVTKMEQLAARGNNAGIAQQAQDIKALYARQSALMGGGGMPVMQPNIWGGPF